MKLGGIYDVINTAAPFSLALSYDNAGLLVGSRDTEITKILLALDITSDVVNEAHSLGCDLIISHHPIIFHPLKSLAPNTPAYLMAKYGISAICAHTNADAADGAMNKYIFNLIKKEFPDVKNEGICEPLGNGENIGFGYVCSLSAPVTPLQMALSLKRVFGCDVVKYYDSGAPITRFAFASGDGADSVPFALSKGANAFVTGDVRHKHYVDALNGGYSLFDCGHYHTEKIILDFFNDTVKKAFPAAEIIYAKSDRDPGIYSI